MESSSIENEKKNSENNLTQLKYARADLDNLQKRIQRTIDEGQERANGRILLQLLPILDELDLAIQAGTNSNSEIVEGVKMVRGKLWKILETMGLTIIDAMGCPFNPNLHEAVIEAKLTEYPSQDAMRILFIYLKENETVLTERQFEGTTGFHKIRLKAALTELKDKGILIRYTSHGSWGLTESGAALFNKKDFKFDAEIKNTIRNKNR